ncbi:hypothetical protein [Allofournierella sp.]|uniref:hypothetical protein n=1 Tax=Allofournierella sp. TaxID=1940256 RepID=UPI003AB1A2A0
MKRFKRWLCQHFLPNWAVESLRTENDRLRTQLLESQAQVAKLEAYIDGIEAGLRAQRRVVIHNNAGGDA